MDIREQKYIRITGNLTIRTTLMLGSFLINSHIQGKRLASTTHPVISPLSFIFVRASASTVQGIFGFTTSTAARGATLRVRNTAGVADFNGVVYDSNLILKGRICHKCYIRDKNRRRLMPFASNTYMGEWFACTQTNFPYQNLLKSSLCRSAFIHTLSSLAIMYQTDSSVGCGSVDPAHLRFHNQTGAYSWKQLLL